MDNLNRLIFLHLPQTSVHLSHITFKFLLSNFQFNIKILLLIFCLINATGFFIEFIFNFSPISIKILSFSVAILWSPLTPLVEDLKIFVHEVSYRKFNSEQFLLEACFIWLVFFRSSALKGIYFSPEVHYNISNMAIFGVLYFHSYSR